MTQARKTVKQVVVLNGPTADAYHRPDPENPQKPACHGHKHTDKPADQWKLWDIEEAQVWKEPCKYPGCWE